MVEFSKALSAFGTLKGLLPGVLSLMNVQIGLMPELSMALVALIGLLASVDPSMFG